MNRIALAFVAALLLTAVACAPTTSVVAEEHTTRLSFEQAYAEAINVISTQPYPSDSTGWAITRSDQEGGFISAELTRPQCSFFGLSCREETAVVSIAIVRRSGDTAVNVSSTRHNVAIDLVARLSERLGL